MIRRTFFAILALMFGILLAALGSLLEEVSNSVGKFALIHRLEQPAVMGALNSAWTLLYFGAISLFIPGAFVIAPPTIPWLGALILLGGVQTVVTLFALRRASRSTFCLLRTLTIPVLALIDACTGIVVAPMKFVAMGLMFASMVWLHRNHGIERRGAGLVLFTAVNGAVALATLKHVFSLGTSVAAAEIVILVPLLFVLIVWAMRSPHQHLEKQARMLFVQTAAYGAATIVESYALLFGPASVITSALRSCAVLWSVASGKTVFHERHLKEKLIGSGVIMIGLALLVIG